VVGGLTAGLSGLAWGRRHQVRWGAFEGVGELTDGMRACLAAALKAHDRQSADLRQCRKIILGKRCQETPFTESGQRNHVEQGWYTEQTSVVVALH
jgi:hypothetical protein